MAKRFSTTEKWQDGWFSSLKPLEKLVFLYIVDTCDNAGFFEINSRLNSFIIGISEQEYLQAIKGIERGFYWGKDGKKIWLRTFLVHQKNWPLNESNNAHKQILSIIESNRKNFEEHIINFSPLLAPNQGLISPIGNGTGKGIGKGIVDEEKIFQEFKTKSNLPDWQIKEEIPKYIKWATENKLNDILKGVNGWVSRVKPQETNPHQPKIKLK